MSERPRKRPQFDLRAQLHEQLPDGSQTLADAFVRAVFPEDGFECELLDERRKLLSTGPCAVVGRRTGCLSIHLGEQTLLRCGTPYAIELCDGGGEWLCYQTLEDMGYGHLVYWHHEGQQVDLGVVHLTVVSYDGRG
jgi:hypothetical protein